MLGEALGLLSAGLGIFGANNAADAQKKAYSQAAQIAADTADKQMKLYQGNYQQIRNDMSPYTSLGKYGAERLAGRFGLPSQTPGTATGVTGYDQSYVTPSGTVAIPSGSIKIVMPGTTNIVGFKTPDGKYIDVSSGSLFTRKDLGLGTTMGIPGVRQTLDPNAGGTETNTYNNVNSFLQKLGISR